MAEEPARMVHDLRDDTNASETFAPIRRDHLTARELFDGLVDRARVRIRWIGAGRLLGGAGAALVIAGLGWWLLRSPALPTEAGLPVTTHADDVARTTAQVAVAPSAARSTTPLPL